MSNSNGFSFSNGTNGGLSGYEMEMAMISVVMGLGLGLVVGIILYLIYSGEKHEMLRDDAYWLNDDGMGEKME